MTTIPITSRPTASRPLPAKPTTPPLTPNLNRTPSVKTRSLPHKTTMPTKYPLPPSPGPNLKDKYKFSLTHRMLTPKSSPSPFNKLRDLRRATRTSPNTRDRTPSLQMIPPRTMERLARWLMDLSSSSSLRLYYMEPNSTRTRHPRRALEQGVWCSSHWKNSILRGVWWGWRRIEFLIRAICRRKFLYHSESLSNLMENCNQ